MHFNPRVRMVVYTLHVIVSVGWLGAAAAYLTLAIMGLTTPDGVKGQSAYVSMESIARFAILPASFAALLTGVAHALGTPWGLFRHYWVIAKLVLGSIGTAILLGHLRSVTRMAAIAREAELPWINADILPMQLLVHASAGVGLLVAITVISVFKPWGKTPWRA